MSLKTKAAKAGLNLLIIGGGFVAAQAKTSGKDLSCLQYITKGTPPS